MKYSIIIPVYQSEATIARCLDSLLIQDMSEAEILVINDGSFDLSGKICQHYAARYSCIRYFEKENNGVSSARNLGLDNAYGDYVLFVDSDDYVTENYINVISKALVNTDIDLLGFGAICFPNNKRVKDFTPIEIHDSKKCAEHLSVLMRQNRLNNLPLKVFKRSIIGNKRFNEQLNIAEDLEFIFSYILNVESVKFINECLYCIDETDKESLSRRIRKDLGRQLFDADMLMYEALNHNTVDENIRNIYRNTLDWMFYRSAYSAFKESKKFNYGKKEQKKYIKRICKMYKSSEIKPKSWKTIFLSLPVLLELSSLINFIMQFRE